MLASLGLNHETALAQSADETSTAELLTYSELMRLPRDRQIQYLEGVRTILVDLSKNPDGRISDSDLSARSKLKAWLQWMNDEIKTAAAQKLEPSKPAANPCAKNAACADKMYECYTRRIGVKWDESSGSYACDDSRPVKTVHRTTGTLFMSKQKRIEKALSQTVEDPRRDTAGQGPIVLPDAVTPQELAAAKASQIDSAPDDAAGTPSTTETKPNELAAAIKASRESAPSKAFPAFNVPAETQMSTAPSIPVSNPISKPVESSPTAEVVSDEKPLATTSAETPAEVSSGEVTLTPRARQPNAAKAHRTKKRAVTAAPDLSKFTCAPKPDVCEAREKVYQGKLACVFAGMVSKLDSKNRKCEAITEFKLGSASYKCSSGQTMCNPLLFGTVSETKPICVGRGNNVTEQCGKISSAHDAEVFLNRNESGLQNRWDEFRTAMANICKPGTIEAKFHCVECNVMKSRIFELHAKLVGDPCKTGASTFDNAIQSRIKSRSAPTSK